MSSSRSRWTGFWVPVVALVAVLGAGAWLVTQEANFEGDWDNNSRTWDGPGSGPGDRGMGRDGEDGRMMGGSGYGWLPGDGNEVDTLAQARDRAAEYADTLEPGLEVGEVMEFSNHYYAELQEPDGAKATEVLVNPDDGAVQMEFGPARMWNTRFGMMGGGDGTSSEVTAGEALQIANEWLADRSGGLTADTAEAFPGYYTLHTLKDGEVEGMLSVSSTAGDAWYHSWHGDFIEMSEGS